MELNYFVDEKESIIIIDRKAVAIDKRNKRPKLPGFSKRDALLERPYVAHRVSTGDIINVTFRNRGKFYMFSGICLNLKKRSFQLPSCTLLLRNIILGVGVELTFSLFYNRAYRLMFNDFQRKEFFYKKNKLFHLRLGKNQQTRSQEII